MGQVPFRTLIKIFHLGNNSDINSSLEIKNTSTGGSF